MNEEIKWLSAQVLMASEQVEGDGIAMCATGTSRYAPTENAINSAGVIIAQIRGLKALLEGNNDQFEAYMKEAVALEDQTNYPTGPPSIAKPSFEQYGEWLLTQGNYNAALEQFKNALKRMPRRSKALTGKLKALRALGLQDEAEIVQNELESILAKADNKLLSSI